MKPTPDYEIEIGLKGSDVRPLNPLPEMHVGETVRFSTDLGEVRIVFPGSSPFRADQEQMTEVPGSIMVTLLTETAGDGLPFGCIITRPDKSTIGWSPTNPGSGANVKVGVPMPAADTRVTRP
jgi:hypothetical protein